MASHHTSHAHRVVEELLAECELNFNPGLHLEPHYEQYVRPMKKELHQCSVAKSGSWNDRDPPQTEPAIPVLQAGPQSAAEEARHVAAMDIYAANKAIYDHRQKQAERLAIAQDRFMRTIHRLHSTHTREPLISRVSAYRDYIKVTLRTRFEKLLEIMPVAFRDKWPLHHVTDGNHARDIGWAGEGVPSGNGRPKWAGLFAWYLPADGAPHFKTETVDNWLDLVEELTGAGVPQTSHHHAGTQ